jgi:protein-tyrosine-phosphatase
MAQDRLSVLFLCTGNSARSQMAEALLRQLSANRIEVCSAGSTPEAQLHPLAKTTLEGKYGIDTAGLRPKPLNQFLSRHFDYVITVCDRASEICPVFPGDPQRIHWSFEDPAAVKDETEQRRAFEHVATGLGARLRIWLSLPDVSRRLGQYESLSDDR